MKTVTGHAIVYRGDTGHNVNTDVIIPGKYVEYDDPKLLGEHAMEGLDPDFVNKVRKGNLDILIVGSNFGSGSSREQAVSALKGAGISVVIAADYARIFYRNGANLALPPVEADIADRVSTGDELEINFETGEIRNLTRKGTYQMKPFPGIIKTIIEAGGLIPYVREKKNLK